MKEAKNNQITTIDATGQSLGRLASEIALLLRGKRSPSFEPRTPGGGEVHVTHVQSLRLTGKKDAEKMKKFYSGYPSGLKHRSFRGLLSKDPERTLRRTVRGMMPNNRWRDRLLKNLKVE